LTTVFVCVGVVTVVVCGGCVIVLVWVTVLVWGDAVLVVVGVVGAAAVFADFVCADAVAVWVWEAWGSAFACAAVGVLLPVLAVALSARLEAV
jgi:hypothetical protein